MKAVVTTCPECHTETKFEYGNYRIVRGPTGQGPKGNFKKVKRSAEDIRTSNAVRARDKACRRCGETSGLDAAHIMSRRYKATRHDMETPNIIALCRSCHKWNHDYPQEFEEWVISWMGEQKYEELRQKAQGLSKRVKRSA